MQFFMVRHYIYDGCGRADMDDVIPCSTAAKRMDYLAQLYKELPDHYWEDDPDVEDFKLLNQYGPGQYGFDYYYLEAMTMDEEI